MHRNEARAATLAPVALLVLILIGAAVWAFRVDRYERDLLAGGHCAKGLEALYTPPPTAHSTCSGEGASRYCTTWYSQRDPYLRSLWRCLDPADGEQVEFWRRTAEEFGQ